RPARRPARRRAPRGPRRGPPRDRPRRRRGSCRCASEGDADPEVGASGLRPVDRAAQSGDALPDGLGAGLVREAAPVVVELERERIAQLADAHRRPGGPRVADGVVERLLDDAVQAGGHRRWELRQLPGSIEGDVDPGRPRVARAVLADGAEEAERRQGCRDEGGGRPAHLVQRLVEVVLDLSGVLGGEAALAEREQLEAGGGERLTRAVVELASDAAPLLVLERDAALGEQRGDALLGARHRPDREEEEEGTEGGGEKETAGEEPQRLVPQRGER